RAMNRIQKLERQNEKLLRNNVSQNEQQGRRTNNQRYEQNDSYRQPPYGIASTVGTNNPMNASYPNWNGTDREGHQNGPKFALPVHDIQNRNGIAPRNERRCYECNSLDHFKSN